MRNDLNFLPKISKVELRHQLTGLVKIDVPHLFIEGVNSRGERHTMRLYIQIGKANLNKFSSILNLKHQCASFRAPIPIKNYGVFVSNQLYDIRIMYDNRTRDENEEIQNDDGDDNYNMILYKGKIEMSINLYKFKPLLITTDSALLYAKLDAAPFDEPLFPQGILENNNYIQKFPNLMPESRNAKEEPLTLLDDCKFIKRSQKNKNKKNAAAAFQYYKYDVKNALPGKVTIMQNPFNKLENFVLLTLNNQIIRKRRKNEMGKRRGGGKIKNTKKQFPEAWVMRYKALNNDNQYEQIYRLGDILKNPPIDIRICKMPLRKLFRRVKRKASDEKNLRNGDSFVNLFAVDQCVGVSLDKDSTPRSFSERLISQPTPSKEWFLQSPFLGISPKIGLTFITHEIDHNKTCFKSLFNGYILSDDPYFFFLRKEKNNKIDIHPILKCFIKETTKDAKAFPDVLEIKALVRIKSESNSYISAKEFYFNDNKKLDFENVGLLDNFKTFPLVSFLSESKMNIKKAKEIGPFPFFTAASLSFSSLTRFSQRVSAAGTLLIERNNQLPSNKYLCLSKKRKKRHLNPFIFDVSVPSFDFRFAYSPSNVKNIITLTDEFFFKGDEGNQQIYVVWWTKSFTKEIGEILGRLTLVRFEDVTCSSYFNATFGAAVITDRWAAFSSPVAKLTNDRQILNTEFLNSALVGQKAQAHTVVPLKPIHRNGNVFCYSIQHTKIKNPSVSASSITVNENENVNEYVLVLLQRIWGKEMHLLCDSKHIVLKNNYASIDDGYFGQLKPNEIDYFNMEAYLSKREIAQYGNEENRSIILMSFVEYINYMQICNNDVNNKKRLVDHYRKFKLFLPYEVGLNFDQFRKFEDLSSYMNK